MIQEIIEGLSAEKLVYDMKIIKLELENRTMKLDYIEEKLGRDALKHIFPICIADDIYGSISEKENAINNLYYQAKICKKITH